MTTSVRGLVVAVTGAARGIGAATAADFAARGARVAIGDLDEVPLKETADRIDAGLFHTLDVTDTTSFRDFIAHVESSLGPIDVLVNNAGIMPVGSILEEDERLTRRIIDVNVHGVITGTKLALASMVPRGRGHIVNVVSMAGENYSPGVATYCASKFAALGFTDSVRMEVRRRGVKLTAVMPAFVKTELTSGTKGAAFIKAVEPSAVAAAIVGAVERPRAHVYVPRAAGLMLKAGKLLPIRAADAMMRRLGAETMFFDDLDGAARRAYEDRVRRS